MARRDARIEGILNVLETMGEIIGRQTTGGTTRAAGQVERFLKLKPPMFEGTGEPEEAERWIDGMEKIFALLNRNDAERITLAKYQLEGNAKHWWKATKGRVFPEGTAPQWEEFLKVFNEKYFSSCAKEKKVTEFVLLIQGEMTVDKYEAKFAELSRFAPRLVEHPEDKAKKFMNGLKDSIRKQLVPLNLKDYSEIYARAQLVEEELNKGKEEGTNKEATRGGKRYAHWRKNPAPGKKPYSRNYGKGGGSHKYQGNKGTQWNTPYAGPGKCFQCGKPGHFKRECPQLGTFYSGRTEQSAQPTGQNGGRPQGQQQRPQAQGRVYAVTQEEAKASNTAIISTLSICDKKAYVLFDKGATHSFVSDQFVKMHGLVPQELEEPFLVSTPMNNVVSTTKSCQGCKIAIDEHHSP